MKCPFCNAFDTQVIDSRVSEEGDFVRRRRRCIACNKRFTTYERRELKMPQVVKKSGSRAEYDREKIEGSMLLALRKRPFTTESVDAAIDRIEEKLLTLGEREVSSDVVGELVMRELRRLDKIAWIRFASVYRNFEDVGEFRAAIKEVQKPGAKRTRRS
jgi:transcriptional repressor NrdR